LGESAPQGKINPARLRDKGSRYHLGKKEKSSVATKTKREGKGSPVETRN